LSASFLGPTTLATLSYTSMARTQQHSPYAALDTWPQQQQQQQQQQQWQHACTVSSLSRTHLGSASS
jgi:hypothetical protein